MATIFKIRSLELDWILRLNGGVAGYTGCTWALFMRQNEYGIDICTFNLN